MANAVVDDTGSLTDSLAVMRSKPARTLSPLRNASGQRILHHGFVECSRLLSADLCAKLASMPMDNAAVISNAIQKDVTGPLGKAVANELVASIQLRDAVSAVFGTDLMEICMPLVLRTEPHTPPQIAHADDHRVRELFGIVHLLDGQLPTEGLRYHSMRIYPTEVAVRCSGCGNQMLLPDNLARRREHLRGNWHWTCQRGGRPCRRTKRRRVIDPESPDDDDEDDIKLLAEFNRIVLSTFRELLENPHDVEESMRCLGPPEIAAGEGIVALPTMIHRGPGAGEAQRLVLFFSVRPVYKDLQGNGETDASIADNDEHDYSEQVHAAWLLARLDDDKEKERVQKLYHDLGHCLNDYE